MHVTCRLAILLFLAAGCSKPAPAPPPVAPLVVALPPPAKPQPIIPQGMIRADRQVIVDEPGPGPQPLDYTIAADPTCELGKGPLITVTLTNKTDQDVYLIRRLELSNERGRYPFCYFEVTRPDTSPSKPVGGICGNVSPLHEDAFVLVPKGVSINPFWTPRYLPPPPPAPRRGLIGPQPPIAAERPKQVESNVVSILDVHPNLVQTPGVYRFRMVYSTASTDIGDYAAGQNAAAQRTPAIKALFDQVPKTVVKSNEIQVTILAPPP